ITDLDGGATDKQNVIISNNEFSATFATASTEGQITGTITKDGRLQAAVTVMLTRARRYASATQMTLDTNFERGVFEGKVSGWVVVSTASSVQRDYRIRFTRASLPQARTESGISEARQETQTALLQAPTTAGIVVDKAKVEKDDHLKTVITKYFNKQKFMGRSSARSLEILDIEDLSVKSISGTTVIVDIKYRAGKFGYGISHIEYATANIEKTVDSYKVISFDRKP
ncbi:MAG: hypothetical protein O7G13_08925, partial [Alphaproteobacteria bacterium]|nr:hypothetical protein [Alphaproteobacteria bacterium]